MSTSRFEVVTSAQAGPVLRDRESGEIMHPGLGPLAEAAQLYLEPARLEARLREETTRPLVLLDVGLGAGTNAICALRLAESLTTVGRRLEIVSFDLTVGALEHALASEQRAAFGFEPELCAVAQRLIEAQHYESARVSWRLVLGDALSSLATEPAASADVVFWDPFSPRVDSRMWSEHAFKTLRRVCRAGATVHTYSAATATRSALLLAGFCVGLGPSCGAKQRHSTFAATELDALALPLDHKWLASLTGAADDTLDAALTREARARLAQLPQLARDR